MGAAKVAERGLALAFLRRGGRGAVRSALRLAFVGVHGGTFQPRALEWRLATCDTLHVTRSDQPKSGHQRREAGRKGHRIFPQ
jgi:hypothetical protein